MTKNRVIIILGLVIVGLILLVQDGCRKNIRYKSLWQTTNSSLVLEEGRNKGHIDVIEANKKDLKILRESNDSLVSELAHVADSLIRARKNPKIITKVVTNFQFDTVWLTQNQFDTVFRGDTILLYAKGEYEKISKWVNAKVTTSKDSVGLHINNIREELVVNHRFKGGLFKRSKLITEIESKNPYITLEDAQSLHILTGKELNKKKPFTDRVGVYGGIGVGIDTDGRVRPNANVSIGIRIW
jgi:hypothetical protein